MKGSKKGFGLLFFALILTAVSFIVAGCNDNNSSNGDSVTGYGGSVPRGDYVTADVDVNDRQITINNHTIGAETSLPFGGIPESVPDIGTSIIHVTDPDTDGNCYLMAMVENRVLGLHKMDAELTPIAGELPVYMFEQSRLTAGDLKGKSFNFMELFAGGSSELFVEIGIVGFDTDVSGRLYGAAHDSEDGQIYSITDEDGLEDSGDEFSLDLTEPQDDGSLVLWENGEENWNAATTLTGSASGPVVLDHGPGAGGGAGFAFPQVTETDADAFWDTVGGDYFMIAYYSDGEQTVAEYYRCHVAQDGSGPENWAGQLELYYPDSSESIVSIRIIPLQQTIVTDIENSAGFSGAQSEAVQKAALGAGIFQESTTEPEFLITFDPNGDYLMGVKTGGSVGTGFDWVTGFGLGMRDRNWDVPVGE